MILDEVHRVPELFTGLKRTIDAERASGRFILTGPTNVLLLPNLDDSLTGRMVVLRLHPLAQCELSGNAANFLHRLFESGFPLDQQLACRRRRSGANRRRGPPGCAGPCNPAAEVRVVSGLPGDARPAGHARARSDFPDVELGRLNVSRAPSRVLDHARILAVGDLPAGAGLLYGLSAEEAADLLEVSFASVERLHSPLQNLALYRELMTFGEIEFFAFEQAPKLDLAAIFLASAAERSKPITEDAVRALNLIPGLIELDPADRQLLASKAESVRAAMEIGYGPEGDHDDESGNDHGGGHTSGSDEGHDHG